MPIENPATFKIGGDLEVHRLGLGTLRLTTERGFGPLRPGARELLKEAVARGVDFIDTADSYGPAHAESALAEALHPYPPALVIASKGGFLHENVEDWKPLGHPHHLRQACESSLMRLKLETIPLYQLHTPDPDVPYADSVGTLKELRAEGKIRHIGVSNVNIKQLQVARDEVEIVSVQNPFNVAFRENDDVLDFCAGSEIAFIAWMPMAEGMQLPSPHLERVVEVAQKYHARPAQVALAALLHLAPVVIVIPGTGSLPHLLENAAATKLKLDVDDLDVLWNTGLVRCYPLGEFSQPVADPAPFWGGRHSLLDVDRNRPLRRKSHQGSRDGPGPVHVPSAERPLLLRVPGIPVAAHMLVSGAIRTVRSVLA